MFPSAFNEKLIAKRPFKKGLSPVSLVLIGAMVIAGCQSTKREELAKGIQSSDTAYQEASVTFQALMESAAEARAGKRYAEAAKLYRSATKVEKNGVQSFVALGEVLAEGGAPQEAAEAFRLALKKQPQDPDALRGLGNSLVVLGQPDLAVSFFKQSIKLRPQDPAPYIGLGVSYDMLGQFKDAQAIYEEGLVQVPGNPDIMANKGLSLALVGDYTKAIQTGRVAYSLGGNAFQYRNILSLIYGISGEFQEARKLSIQDYDSTSLERNINYFRNLHGLKDPLERVKLLRAYYQGAGA